MKLLLVLSCILTFGFSDAFYEAMTAYKNNQFLQAKTLFERSIQEEHSIHGNFYLGKMYLRGEGVDVHLPTAITYLEQAVIKGNIKAQCFLAEAYLKSRTKRDSAILLLQEGAKESFTCKEVAAVFKIPLNDAKYSKGINR
jgi:TPR repeat protein